MILNPEISIILSTYNRNRPHGDCLSLVKRAIDSILNQSFFDFELVLIDDASTDGTTEICREYAANDCRVKLILHEHNSQLPAKCYNEGISASSGRYICFMFDDDVLLPNALKDLYAFFKLNLPSHPNLAMVYGLAEYYDMNKNELFDAHFGGEWNLHLLHHHNLLANCCVMIKRDVFDTVGGYDENPVMRRNCDWNLWKRIGRRYTVLRTPIVVAQVYQNYNDSIGALYKINDSAIKKHCRTRNTFPLKVKSFHWPQKIKYMRTFFVIYTPFHHLYLYYGSRVKLFLKSNIKKTLSYLGYWDYLKNAYENKKT